MEEAQERSTAQPGSARDPVTQEALLQGMQIGTRVQTAVVCLTLAISGCCAVQNYRDSVPKVPKVHSLQFAVIWGAVDSLPFCFQKTSSS